ncbi:MAG: hypothetical protein OEY84_07965 [Rhodospirillaceae bacterium]|nr:hypothetical protein [Rhodospirillaceae bacterium]
MGNVIKINPKKKSPAPINACDNARCRIGKVDNNIVIQRCFQAIAQNKYAEASAIASEIIACSKNSAEPSCINKCALAAEYVLEEISHYY